MVPPKADLKANILAGAGQIRALGRLALFANASLVYENLRDLLALARDYKDERPSGERHYIYEPYTPTSRWRWWAPWRGVRVRAPSWTWPSSCASS